MNGFSAGSCVRFGWETFKKRPWFLIGSYVVLFAVIEVISLSLAQFTNDGVIVASICTVARYAIEMLSGMGTIAFTLKAHDDIEHVRLMDLWHPYPFWKYTGATVLFAIVFIVGLVLLIVPGIIWSLMFGFAGYLVIDRHLWPMEAMRESRRITYGYKRELFLLGILTGLIVLLGLICLIVGVLVAYPIVALASAHAFRTLEARSTNPSDATVIA